jgi:hypothetical protein
MAQVSQEDIALAIERGRFAVNPAHAQALAHIVGVEAASDFYYRMYEVPGPYRQYIHKTFAEVVGAFPGLADTLLQPDGFEQAARTLCGTVNQFIADKVPAEVLNEFRNTHQEIADRVLDALKDTQGDGKSSLGDELEVPLEVVSEETWRLRSVIPPSHLGLGLREVENLKNALGMQAIDPSDQGKPDEYVQAILLPILEVILKPEEVDIGGLRSISRVWGWAGIKKPNQSESLSYEDIADAIASLLVRLGNQENRQEMTGNMLGRMLRRDYGLGRGRGLKSTRSSAIEESQPRNWDNNAPDPYEQVESQAMWREFYHEAPPAQREAIAIMLESEETGQTLAKICRNYDKDPNLVRNNIRARKKAYNKKYPLT